MVEFNNGGQMFIGVVEDNADPLKVGRVKVRVVGLHTHDAEILPYQDLPWAFVTLPAAPTTRVGSTVVVFFNDWPECQMPIVIGAIPGIPQET